MHVGDTLTVTVMVTRLDSVDRRVVLQTRCVNQAGETVIDGQAEVMAPADKLRIHRTDLPEPLLADKNLRYDQLLAAARRYPRIRMGVVHPCRREALEGAVDAAGIVMGARVPVVLTRRADSTHSRIASCAIALLWVNRRPAGVA